MLIYNGKCLFIYALAPRIYQRLGYQPLESYAISRQTDPLSNKSSTSRELDQSTAGLPFNELIKLGMVVLWVPPAEFAIR